MVAAGARWSALSKEGKEDFNRQAAEKRTAMHQEALQHARHVPDSVPPPPTPWSLGDAEFPLSETYVRDLNVTQHDKEYREKCGCLVKHGDAVQVLT